MSIKPHFSWYMSLSRNQHNLSQEKSNLPRVDNAFFSFRASIGIQEVSHYQEANFTRYIAELLILSSCSSAGDEEQHKPRQAHFEEHLEVQNAKHPRIQFRAHEEVIDGIASHSVLSTTIKCREIC